MIQLGTIVTVADKTGVIFGQCIKVLGNRKRYIGKLGDLILISVKWINVKRIALLKEKLQQKYSKGTIHRALIIRTKINYVRLAGVYIRFNENAVIIVNKKRVPYSNRVFGPMLREFCLKWPWLGCVSRCIV